MFTKIRVESIACSFCGKQNSAVEKMIAGPEVYICGKTAREVNSVAGNAQHGICNECLDVCQEIIGDAAMLDVK